MRIFICGAHSTGKTSLMEEIALRIPIHVIREVARELIQDLGWSRDQYDWKKNPESFAQLQKMIIHKQCEIEERNISIDYIMDRGIDPLVYARTFFSKETSDTLSQEPEMQQCIKRYRDSCIFVLWPHKECIVDDGVRQVPVMEDLIRFTHNLLQILQEWNIPYHLITALNMQERLQIVLDEITKYKLKSEKAN